MDRELEVAIEIIKQAGEIVLGYQSKLNDNINDNDILSQADLEFDNLIRTKIYEIFPDDKIMSDEVENDFTSFGERIWMIDSLDGTKDFLWKGERYSVMIWLCVDWKPELWVVFCPSSCDLYYAKRWNWAFFFNQKNQSFPQRIEVSKIDNIEDARYLSKSKFSEPRLVNEKIKEKFSFKETLDWWSLGIVVWEIARWIADCYILTNKVNVILVLLKLYFKKHEETSLMYLELKLIISIEMRNFQICLLLQMERFMRMLLRKQKKYLANLRLNKFASL